MKLIGLIVLSLFTGVLSVDWYVCFIKKQCISPPNIIQEVQATPQPSVKTSIDTIEDSVEIIKGRIHFKSGAKKFLKSRKVQKYLHSVASQWKNQKNKVITVTGHTDNRGSKRANYKLGLYRSKAIKKTLIQFGVDKDYIKIKSKGEISPMSSNRTKKGRFLNRRVEINLK